MTTINFKGKNSVVNHHLSVAFHELKPCKGRSVLRRGEEPSINGNMVIRGDNLLALKALLPSYAGRVNCVYIDPPYNTGNEGWCYNDRVNNPMFREWLGKAVDRDDLTRHDKWCCMMYPRLCLLRELLAEDGVIFISIDDNEQHRLRALMDEIFGEDNFIGQFVWRKKYGGGKGANFYVDMHEYILCYSKNISQTGKFAIDRNTKQKEVFSETDDFYKERGKYYVRPLKSGLAYRKNLIYKIECPDGQFVETQWICAKETFQQLLSDGRIVFKKLRNGKYNVYKKFYEKDNNKVLPESIIYDLAYNQNGKEQIKDIFNIKEGRDVPFENAKPTQLIKHLFNFFEREDAVFLDSFAGSGTTAQSVLELNREDGGNRRFILVECEDYADTITAERVRRVIRGVPTAKDSGLKQGLGGGFSYWRLGKPLELQSILSGNNLPTYEDLASYLFYTATGENYNPCQMKRKDNYVGESEHYKIYLFYKPDIKYLMNTALTMELAEKISPLSKRDKQNKQLLVFAPINYTRRDELDRRRIKFSQLPYEIYRTAEKRLKND